MADIKFGEFSLERMDRAVQMVRERLLRSTAALQGAAIPYAVVGGCAVAEWVARVDESAVRYANDVDILIRRSNLSRVTQALKVAGFSNFPGTVDAFIDSPGLKLYSALKIMFAAEKQRPSDLRSAPDVNESERGKEFQVLALERLVRLGLSSYRIEDRMLLRDMLDVRLMDESWLAKLPADLAARLKELIDTPDG